MRKSVGKKIGLGLLITLVCLIAAGAIYGYAADYHIIRVLMVELAPEYSFRRITRGFDTTRTEHILWYSPPGTELPAQDMEGLEKAYEDACSFWQTDPVEILGGEIRYVWLPGESRYDQSRIAKALGEKLQGRSISSHGIVYSIFSYSSHELNHAVAGTVNETATFLNEGFANYLNKVNWDTNVRDRMKEATEDGAVIPLDALLTHRDFRSQDASIAYAQSAMLVKYLVEEKNPELFRELYRTVDYSDSREVVIDKIQRVYSESFDVFGKDWNGYLRNALS